MVKVFLVDDEIVFREGVRNSFPWDESGYTLVGEAPDGEIALTMIRDQNPDIIVTDIRMPFMDGLQLCAEIRRIMPWAGIIILSGYDDFTYARKAMAMGVQEYLLKPVNVTELRDALDRVYGRMQEEKRLRENARGIRERMGANNRFVKDKLLFALLADELDEKSAATMIEQLRKIGINLFAQRYAVLDISFEQNENQTRDKAMDVLYSLSDASSGAAMVCTGKKGALAIILGDSDADTEERAYGFADSAVKALEESGFRRVLVTVGDTVTRLTELPASMKAARHLRHLHTLGEQTELRVVGSRDIGSAPEKKRQMTIRPLHEQIQYISASQLDSLFDSYVQSLDAGDLHAYVVSDYLQVEAMLTANRIVLDAGGDPEQVLGSKESMSFGDHDFAAARGLLRKAIEYRDKNATHKTNPAIARARSYMSQHFQDPNLMLQDVADHVGMSSSRFSTVFSQETGYTFTEYLTELRLSKAKELLRATQLRSHQICEMVGYNDPHYFSYLFRKNTGVTPSEYRRAEKG
ncbi:MAG: response regulator [Clostridia bacterium]|nr:response regulator [Clostridia bacterium]